MIKFIKKKLYPPDRGNKMIKFIKSKMYPADPDYILLTFQYRDKPFYFAQLKKDQSAEGEITCVANKKEVIALRDWFNKALAEEEKNCEECWNAKIPEELKVHGKVQCRFCDAEIVSGS